MADYTELHGLWNNGDLRHRVMVALYIKAEAIRALGVAATAAQKDWANSPGLQDEAADVVKRLVAANSGLTTGQIVNANDSAVQSNVDAYVDFITDNVV